MTRNIFILCVVTGFFYSLLPSDNTLQRINNRVFLEIISEKSIMALLFRSAFFTCLSYISLCPLKIKTVQIQIHFSSF